MALVFTTARKGSVDLAWAQVRPDVASLDSRRLVVGDDRHRSFARFLMAEAFL